MIRRPPRSTLFPTRRSSDLQVRQWSSPRDGQDTQGWPRDALGSVRRAKDRDVDTAPRGKQYRGRCPASHPPDRKSTRLNSSHVEISYAVFCLKKKKNSTNKN